MMTERHYDVDWLRTAAMALLVIYHATLIFQPWAQEFGLPQNSDTLEESWVLMSMFNVWRIPIVFMISGMGVRFSMERRDWKALLRERTLRILVPFLFAIIVLQAIANVLMEYFGWNAPYAISFGHLWFLPYIYLYFLLAIGPMYWLRNNSDNAFYRFVRRVMPMPGGLLVFTVPVMLEAMLVDPEGYTSYAGTPHGFFIGFVCFVTGFVLVSQKDVFWSAATKTCWSALVLALSIYLIRLFVYDLGAPPQWLSGLETMCWMLALLGFANRYLNQPSRALAYLSVAVYPVYIVHQPVLYGAAYLVLPLQIAASLKLGLLLGASFGVSLLLYEFVLRRIKWARPVFGMKLRS
jgi:surface polysaccharide O-acyltransferase-like enzyme